jgi:hypothetical protein
VQIFVSFVISSATNHRKRRKEKACGTAGRRQLAYKQFETGRLRIEILVYRNSEAVVARLPDFI